MGRDSQPPDQTLADAAWLQRLARSLVRSADLAEDLCQDTWLANLKDGEAPSRPWLARVIRNLAISLLRRDTRRRCAERSAGDEDPNPDTSEVVAEAEIQRRAVDALMELPEPYRSTLLLRFMKGLSYRDVAKQTRVPIETVRTRIKRGLSQLRQKLDQDHGGRRTWLAPLTLPSFGIGTAALWGIVLMNIQTKLMLAGTGLAAALLVTWFGVLAPGSLPELVNQAERVTPLVADLGESDSKAPTPDREKLEASVETPPSREEELGSLLVRLTWHDTKQPAAGLPLRIGRDWDPDGDTVFESARNVLTGDDGTVLVEGLQPGSFRILTNRAFYDREGMSQIGAVFDLEPGEAEVVEHEIAPGVDIRGQVRIDTAGRWQEPKSSAPSGEAPPSEPS